MSPQGDPHEALESGAGVLQAEGHAGIAKHTTRGEKCCLFLVLLRHLDLVVARERIQKTEQCAAGGGVHDLVDPREGIGVFGAGLVEVGEVDAEAASSGVLGDDYTVGEPSGMDIGRAHV